MKALLIVALVVCAWQKAAALDNLDTVYMRQQTYIIDHLQFSPDDKYILVQNYENTAVVEAATGETVFTKYYLSRPVWSKDGKYIFAVQGYDDLKFWVKVETGTWKTVDSFPSTSSFDFFCISSDERTAAVKVGNDALAFYDLVNKRKIKEIKYFHAPDYPKPGTGPSIVRMVWSEDNRYLIYTASDGKLRFWDVERDSVVYTYAAGYGVLIKNSDGSKIAFKTGKQEYAVQIMDVATKQITGEIQGIAKEISDIAFSNSGEYIATAMLNAERLKVYRTATMEMIREWAAGTIDYVSYSHNNKYIAASNAFYLLLFNAPGFVSVQENNNNTGDVEFYPNPVKDVLTLNLGANVLGVVQISIVSQNGSLVLTGQQFLTGNNSEFSINVGTLPSGAYTAVLQAGNNKRSFHFIKL